MFAVSKRWVGRYGQCMEDIHEDEPMGTALCLSHLLLIVHRFFLHE
jgi:hypothetical protein